MVLTISIEPFEAWLISLLFFGGVAIAIASCYQSYRQDGNADEQNLKETEETIV